ncbi:hypothetical protein G9P44_002968 [Scheffersomyces stipitis]|nr:hypothetical protein G9P44_002968 [Scheffersomyces stipitis]
MVTSQKKRISRAPLLREGQFGHSIGSRTKYLEVLNNELGPPDLFHWAKYVGVRSAEYTSKSMGESLKNSNGKEDDGYIGYYHFVNGLGLDSPSKDVQNYVLHNVGIVQDNDEYYFSEEILTSDRFSVTKKEMVLTYCTYNVFSKSDFRVRIVVQMYGSSKKLPLHIDTTYHVIPRHGHKNTSYTSQNISDLSSSFWEEVKVSNIIRSVVQLDNPALQLTGLVSYGDFTQNSASLEVSVKLLVKFLNRGTSCGSNPGYGTATACGHNNESPKKTNHYRNNLVDSLLRLCKLDISGSVCDLAVREINSKFKPGEWDYLILRIYKIQRGSNKEHDYLELSHQHLSTFDVHTTQSALILVEQVYFLISKERYDMALVLAQKSVQILPLDFECWYSLVLTYILVGDFERALLVFNSLPVTLNPRTRESNIESVSGARETYTSMFTQRIRNNEEPISEKNFNLTFPAPSIKSESGHVPVASINKIWHDLFIFNPHLRHSINGNHFSQSPIVNGSARDISSVDQSILKICGLYSSRNMLSMQSSGTPTSSLLDFTRKSTWGRSYDLLSLFIALVGWDQIVTMKDKLFSGPKNTALSSSQLPFVVDHGSKVHSLVNCEPWLDQLFLVIYDDLKTIMTLTSAGTPHHSAIEWEMLGLLGWSVKYNLKESICSLMTSVIGVARDGGFDYFGTVQLLEIYDELILSDAVDTNIDLNHDDYDIRFYSNKLILKASSKERYQKFIKTLEEEFLTLDFILINLMKLISWNARWYQMTPNHLVVKILSNLLVKYDSVSILTSVKVLFEQNKKHKHVNSKKSSGIFSFGSLLGSSESNIEEYEFEANDTIYTYIEELIGWLEDLSSHPAL